MKRNKNLNPQFYHDVKSSKKTEKIYIKIKKLR